MHQRFTCRAVPAPLARMLAACAAAATLAAVTASPAAANAGFNTGLARLAGLQNYSFTTSSSNNGYTFRIQGSVHGPRDWEITSTAPLKESTYDVNGHGYALALGQVIHEAFKTPEGYTHLDGERSAAQGLIGYTHVRGIRIRAKGSCKVAGTAGTVYRLETPTASAHLLLETVSACIAKQSGALLSYTAGIPSGSVLKSTLKGIRGASNSFRVDGIGKVGVIRPPRPHASPANASAPTA